MDGNVGVPMARFLVAGRANLNRAGPVEAGRTAPLHLAAAVDRLIRPWPTPSSVLEPTVRRIRFLSLQFAAASRNSSPEQAALRQRHAPRVHRVDGTHAAKAMTEPAPGPASRRSARCARSRCGQAFLSGLASGIPSSSK